MLIRDDIMLQAVPPVRSLSPGLRYVGRFMGLEVFETSSRTRGEVEFFGPNGNRLGYLFGVDLGKPPA